jgi:hypothetical protein
MLYANQKSCVTRGCHDKIHDIARLGSADLWGEPAFSIPQALKERASDGAEDPFAEEAQDPFADEGEPDAGSSGGGEGVTP